VILINIVLFYLIRILSVFISFGFGIGASASSSKYDIILPLVDILFQFILVSVIYSRNKNVYNYYHLSVAFTVILTLGVLAFNELIP